MLASFWSLTPRYRDAFYARPFQDILSRLPKWKEERFPPPRVSQSEVSHYFIESETKSDGMLHSMTKLA